jgi:hypothetical protein
MISFDQKYNVDDDANVQVVYLIELATFSALKSGVGRRIFHARARLFSVLVGG